MFHRASIALVLATLVPIALNAQTTQIAKVSALADGRLLLNGKPADIQEIEAELGRVKADFSDCVNERGESLPRGASPPLGK